MRCSRLIAVVAFVTLVAGSLIDAHQGAQTDPNSQHAAWVLECLTRMQTIKPGMSRADLFKVFKEEGGIYSGTEGHYVLRECPYFKVDVVFEPATAGSLGFSRSDRLKTISRPYIQAGIMN